MEKITGFISLYKKDIVYVSCLLFVFIILSVFSGHIFGDIYTDCAREAYVPELILKGKVIYKDIFALFLPLSYWFNALLYLIFGRAFRVLYFYSYINAFFILFGLYLISRIFVKEYLSAVTTLAFMCFFILSNPFSVMTYIYPYAFSMIYAVTFFTYSLLAFLYYMKTDNKKFLYASFLLLGFVYANKPEFLLCPLAMFAVLLFKHEKFKTFLFSFIFMLLPAFLCISALFLQGFSFNDLLSYLSFTGSFFDTPEEKFFTSYISISAFENTGKMLFDFIYFCIYFFVSAAYASLYFKNKYYKIFAVILSPFYLMFLGYLININLSKGYTINLFFWYFPILAVILGYKAFKLNTLQNKMLFFTGIIGILSTSRVLFLPLNKISYAVYFLIPLLTFWLYIITGIKNPVKIKILSVTLIFLSVTYVLPYKYLGQLLEVKEYKSDKGSIVNLYYKSESFGLLADYIKNNAKKDDTVLVLPEGTLLNHITGNDTNPKLYQLTPNHITALGEDNIVNELENNPPDFIVFTDEKQQSYDRGYICENFALKICDFTYKNYKREAEFPVALKVYKLNDLTKKNRTL